MQGNNNAHLLVFRQVSLDDVKRHKKLRVFMQPVFAKLFPGDTRSWEAQSTETDTLWLKGGNDDVPVL